MYNFVTPATGLKSYKIILSVITIYFARMCVRSPSEICHTLFKTVVYVLSARNILNK